MKTFNEAIGAVKPHELHVKPVNKDGKTLYKVHAVGKNFAGGIKKGEHLTDTELDDFSEMGGKVKHMKEAVFAPVMKQGTSKQAYLGSRMMCPTCNKSAPKDSFKMVDGKQMCKDCQDDMKNESVIGGALSAVRGALKTDKNKKEAKASRGSQAAMHMDRIKEDKDLEEMAKRGRPRKNPLPVKSSSDEEGDDYGPDVGPEPDKNIHTQLKKAVDAHDMKGGAHVEFENGKKHFVKSQHASKVLDAMHKLKPADRAKVQDHVYKSHENFMAVHNMLK